jgi:hypothetical protein
MDVWTSSKFRYMTTVRDKNKQGRLPQPTRFDPKPAFTRLTDFRQTTAR